MPPFLLHCKPCRELDGNRHTAEESYRSYDYEQIQETDAVAANDRALLQPDCEYSKMNFKSYKLCTFS